ncbi:MAG TPA: response regulator [Bacillota bacterium]|nr:response regulator [Bacillota bacterium]
MANKILVVEDDSFLLKAYQAKLTNAGFEIQTATNGELALTALETFAPDVILLDLVMPRKDGFTTLQEIKANDKLKNIPVIVTTNLGQPDDIKRVMDLGALECIIKSNLSLSDLVAKLRAL